MSVQEIIDRAFNRFASAECPDSVDAADLKAGYAASIHPRVISGELSEDEVFLEFLTNFSDRNRDGRIHRDEWNAYYNKVAASVNNVEHFGQLMAQAWRL